MATNQSTLPQTRRPRPASTRPASAAGPSISLPDQARLEPGSAGAEAAADALLMRAKRCSLRLARQLRAAPAGGGPVDGLLQASEALELSCAYYTEAQLRRPAHSAGRAIAFQPWEDQREPMATAGSGWLSGLVAGGLEPLAAGIGMDADEARAWVLCVRGESLRNIGTLTGVPTMTVWRLLARAHRKAGASWLAAYRDSLRRTGKPGAR